jgi:hypothetical protein
MQLFIDPYSKNWFSFSLVSREDKKSFRINIRRLFFNIKDKAVYIFKRQCKKKEILGSIERLLKIHSILMDFDLFEKNHKS